ncbi:MAG: hypothetical protein DRH23_02825 [Deltaproteobacteria bacterium]|nr:UPF0262 family protein [Deltaproteobacteria bacterium]MBW2403229.1 UPF0262 family protein [Deltaproteobacteria bacterium]RLB51152.1 MAG: hypothetical protein DRH23_02825 [Deltaproteobacteria bacterium]
MPLHAVVIGERTLARGSEAQHVEWDANVRELLSKAGSQAEDVATLHVSMTEQQFLLDFRDEDDSELVTIIIPHELLSEHITEYIDIVRQIADADGVNQMEALDMAKKVTHDRAGRVLKRELRDVGFDLETSRRLFTLLLSLRVDTTRLVGIHGHRTIR